MLEDWAEKIPLNDLNTDANENYPFLMLDGVTLYFAADGDASMGGYDLFITRLNTSDNTFLKPENIGMPFNSPFNDYMMMVDELHRVGWFASDRFLPEGKVAVYQFIPNTEKKIFRPENSELLIAKAQIRQLDEMDGEFNKITPNVVDQKAPAARKIYINDTTFYADVVEFKSNVARNLYFKLQKLTEETDAAQQELEKLRNAYVVQTNQEQLTETGKKIKNLEYRIRALKPQIAKLGNEMRNEEIKSLR